MCVPPYPRVAEITVTNTITAILGHVPMLTAHACFCHGQVAASRQFCMHGFVVMQTSHAWSLGVDGAHPGQDLALSQGLKLGFGAVGKCWRDYEITAMLGYDKLRS